MTDIIIIICTSLLGFLFGKAYEDRLLEKESLYVNLVDFTSKFKANVSCNRVLLDDYLKQFFENADGCFVCYSKHFLYGSKLNNKIVSKKEASYLERFFCGLKAKSTVELLDHLNYYKTYFSSTLKAVQSDNATKGKIGQKLGLLIGVIVGLVLI